MFLGLGVAADVEEFIFLRFDSKKAATEAIVGMHGADVGGFSVKCSWGKETTNTSQGQSAVANASASAPAVSISVLRISM